MVAKSKSKIKAKAKLASNGSSEPSSTNDNNNIQDFLAPPPKRLGKTGKVLASELCDENDEENIVIDLADEEDEEEDGTESEKFGEPRLVGAGGATSGHYDTSFARSSLDSTTSERASLGHDDKAARSFTVGQLIWFDPNQLGYCIPGKVLEFYAELMVLSVEACSQPASEQETGDDGQRLQVYELSEPALLGLIKPRRPISSEQGLADLAELEEGSLEALIYNLRLRFKQDLIYTHCGRKLLISLNPHRQLGELYDMKQVGMYDTISGRLAAAKSHSADFLKLANDSDHEHLLHQLTSDSSKCQLVAKSSRFIRWLLLNVGADYGSAPLSGLEHQLANASSSSKATGGYDRPPAASSRQATGARAHLFRMADDALRAMLTTGLDQCFLLLGDSGAGKTETCKLLLQYLAAINKSPTNLMTELMLESIQMLESFGNAKTLLNSNSSRFGKIVEINFNLNTGFISNARLTDLNLLDRGRIVSQNEGERNFHIFYELLEGLSPSEKEKYGLQAAKKYFYLNQGHCVTIQQRPGQATPVKEDAEDFRALNAAMQVLGFNYEEQDTIFRILASILHLGNIYFHRKVLAVRSAKLNAPAGDDSAGTEGVEIGSDTELRWVSHLLQIQFEHVLRCLTVRTSETQASAQVADFIVTPLNIDQALDTRDAIARALYSCLFRWLVQRINVAISGAFQAHSSGEHLAAAAAAAAARGLDGLELRNADEESKGEPKEEPIYWCRTSESLCEFQPDKLQQGGASGATKRARAAKEEASKAVIYILDSFGFENLTENQFEQLCINYSAELLHHHTQRYLLRLEQAEYARERLRWQPITSGSVLANFAELQPGVGGCSLATSAQEGTGAHRQSVVSLIAKRPLGLLALLDDECNFPKSSDQSFAEKCHHNHALNDNYQCARLASGAGQEFGVRHFGQQTRLVWYQVEGFVEKNRDSLRADVLELLYGSRMSLVVDMLHKMHLNFCCAEAL